MSPGNPTDDEAALAIELASMCKTLRVLPREGGLLDQDAYQYYLLKAGLEALAVEEERNRKKKV